MNCCLAERNRRNGGKTAWAVVGPATSLLAGTGNLCDSSSDIK